MGITNKYMPDPTNGYNYVEHIIQFVKDIAPFGSAIWISNVFIKYCFKYFTQKRDDRIREVIKQDVTPQITNLETSIKELTKALGGVEQQLRLRP